MRTRFQIVVAALSITLFAPGGPSRAGQFGACPGVDQIEAKLENSSSSGYYIPGLKLIIMNMAVLQAYSDSVRKFIFAHECAHADPAVGQDEAQADCAAVKRGVHEGWLGRPEVIQVCAHLARFPADATHAPIHVRCGAIRQCSGLWDDPRTLAARETRQTPVGRDQPRRDDSTPLTRLARRID